MRPIIQGVSLQQLYLMGETRFHIISYSFFRLFQVWPCKNPDPQSLSLCKYKPGQRACPGLDRGRALAWTEGVPWPGQRACPGLDRGRALAWTEGVLWPGQRACPLPRQRACPCLDRTSTQKRKRKEKKRKREKNKIKWRNKW